jgi:WD40 repeat protein
VAVTGDGQTAVSGAGDNTVRVWDLATGRCRAVLEGHADRVRIVQLTRDGRTVVSASDDGTLRVWDLASGQCRATLRGHKDQIVFVAVSSDGLTAVSGAFDSRVRVWDLAGGKCRAVHVWGSEEVRPALAAVRDEGAFAITLKPHAAILSSTGDGVALACFPGEFTTADCSPDGQQIIAGDGAGGMYFLRLHARTA